MNLGTIELRHLRYFLAVAETGHFTKAAEKVHITQPTLSQQIRQLEGQLNMPLFDRIGRRVKLTAAGELLLPYARRVWRELQDAQSALSELHGLKRGELKVGIVQTVNACVIPDIIARFTAAHGGIKVTCAELSVNDIELGLEAGRLDLGISFLPATRPFIEGEKLFTEELVAVVPAKHAWDKRRRVRVGELSSQPLVLLSSHYCTRQLVDRAFAQARIRPKVQVEMNSVESILSTVGQGRLVSVLPSLALCQRDNGLVAIPLIKPTPRRTVGLLWMRGAHRRIAAQAFAQITQRVLADRRSVQSMERGPRTLALNGRSSNAGDGLRVRP